ncbi:hypothetical protein SAMN05892882_11280 [Rhodopseudomonas pentothenatexigens]|uniref:Uncharacterized protein n=1 Tax=Rhodopseudomonas pentothenatexigens TaxID=999699 RepID=A0A336JPC4_9BRAD|nr:hypothetical protein BJ125_11280 [Rhodopseudomonas pentothenatexigens]SSW91498.1 hypothetical protein SAMN05892882_11280 [Rhodopseudomonas pentothenatexigens]
MTTFKFRVSLQASGKVPGVPTGPCCHEAVAIYV